MTKLNDYDQMKLKTSNILLIGGLVLVITSLLLFFLGPWFIQSMLHEYKPEDRGGVGDAFSGIISPVIAWFGAILTFFAFYIQYEANKEQRKQFEKLSQDQTFFKLLESQESRIINSSFKQENEEIRSYQLLEHIVSKFYEAINEECSRIARNIIVDEPDRIDDAFMIQILQMPPTLNDSPANYILEHFDKLKNDFIENLNRRDKHDRLEYIKYYFNSLGHENSRQMQVLGNIGRLNFYKIDFSRRRALYRNAFENIELKYGSFLDGYFRNWEFISLFISQSSHNDSYVKYLKSQLSKFEIIILFYYVASGYANKELKHFLQKNHFLSNIHHYHNNYLIDRPSKLQLENELKLIFEAKENTYTYH